jgi:hypothetical protein
MNSFARRSRIVTVRQGVPGYVRGLGCASLSGSASEADGGARGLVTRGFNTDGPGCLTGPSLDCSTNPGSTGTKPWRPSDSQFERIEAINPRTPSSRL